MKSWGDLLFALELTREEYRDNRALCSWCQVASLLTVGTAVLTVPEAYTAGRTLAGQGR